MAGIAVNGRSVLGMDVGKRSHWACLVTPEGEVALNRPVANDERELSALFASVPKGTLLVVDQKRNIGALPLRVARSRGLEAAYLPGIAAHQAAKLFAGDAKTDERDALVVAKTAIGIPDALLPVPEPDETRDAARAMAAIGGPWAMLDAGRASASAAARGMGRRSLEAALSAAKSCTRPPELMLAAENPQVRMLARRISEAMAEAGRLDGEISALLAGDETYRCLRTIPGIGPRTASELVIAIDVGEFPDHDHLASYCGIAPRNRQSGSSISSVSASRQGNKRLKNLLIFSCNSLCRSGSRFGEYYRRCRERGMCHGEALKATARKRMMFLSRLN